MGSFQMPLVTKTVNEAYSDLFKTSPPKIEISDKYSIVDLGRSDRFRSDEIVVKANPIAELCKNGAFNGLINFTKVDLNTQIRKIINNTIRWERWWFPHYYSTVWNNDGRPVEISPIYFELLKKLDLAGKAIDFQIYRRIFHRTTRDRSHTRCWALVALTVYLTVSLAVFINIKSIEFKPRLSNFKAIRDSFLFLGPCYIMMSGVFVLPIIALNSIFFPPWWDVGKIWSRFANPSSVIDEAAMQNAKNLEGAVHYFECKKALSPAKAQGYDQRIRLLKEKFPPAIKEVPVSEPSLIERITSIFVT